MTTIDQLREAGLSVHVKHERRVPGVPGVWRAGAIQKQLGIPPLPCGGKTTVRLVSEDGREATGVALCRPDENYVRQYGRDLALYRALISLMGEGKEATDERAIIFPRLWVEFAVSVYLYRDTHHLDLGVDFPKKIGKSSTAWQEDNREIRLVGPDEETVLIIGGPFATPGNQTIFSEPREVVRVEIGSGKPHTVTLVGRGHSRAVAAIIGFDPNRLAARLKQEQAMEPDPIRFLLDGLGVASLAELRTLVAEARAYVPWRRQPPASLVP